MAIGWLTVLSHVPWTEVINNAPKVAEGAKKLWKSVSGKSAETPAPRGASQVPASAELGRARRWRFRQHVSHARLNIPEFACCRRSSWLMWWDNS